MKLPILIALVIGVGVASVSPAVAQSPTWNAAKSAFDQAQADYLAEKYDEAANGFKAAYSAQKIPQFLYNIGAAYHMKGKKFPDPGTYDTAVEYYQRYLSEDPQAADQTKIQRAIEVLKEESTRLKAAPPVDGSTPATATPSAAVQELGDAKVRGLVVIESEPQTANIYINGKEKGPFAQTPWSGSLEGEFSYLVEKRGYKSKEGRLSADPSRLMILTIVMAEEDYLGWLEIKSNVPGASVFLDDKNIGAIGNTPFSGNFKPGKHKVWIAADGYEEVEREIEIIAGETHEISEILKGAPVGYLNVRGVGIESSEILVDGQVLCPRGPCRKPIPVGTHRVAVRRAGYKPYLTTISVQAKTEMSIKPNLVRKPGRSDAVVAYVFSAAFLGGGIYLGLESNKLRDDLRAELDAGDPPIDQNDPRFNRGKYFAIGADAAYALSGVIGLAAIYYTFRDKGPSSTAVLDVRTLAVTPSFGPSFAGVNLETSW